MNYVEHPTWGVAAGAAAQASYAAVLGEAWPWPDVEVAQSPNAVLAQVAAKGEYCVGPDNDDVRLLQIHDGTWVGMHQSSQAQPLDGLRVADCDLQSHQKWASRSYNMRARNAFYRCSFRDVYNEHGIYWNLHGYDGSDVPLDVATLILRRCLFENIGSQAVQTVMLGRDAEYSDPTRGISPGGPIFMRGVLARNVGYNRSGNARASFAFSFFRSHNSVDLAGIFLDNSGQATSRGALLCEARAGSLALSHSIFLTGVLQQPMFKVEGVEDSVEVTDCMFHATGGQAVVDIRNCGSVRVANCGGNVRLRVDGLDVGPIEKGID